MTAARTAMIGIGSMLFASSRSRAVASLTPKMGVFEGWWEYPRFFRSRRRSGSDSGSGSEPMGPSQTKLTMSWSLLVVWAEGGRGGNVEAGAGVVAAAAAEVADGAADVAA